MREDPASIGKKLPRQISDGDKWHFATPGMGYVDQNDPKKLLPPSGWVPTDDEKKSPDAEDKLRAWAALVRKDPESFFDKAQELGLFSDIPSQPSLSDVVGAESLATVYEQVRELVDKYPAMGSEAVTAAMGLLELEKAAKADEALRELIEAAVRTGRLAERAILRPRVVKSRAKGGKNSSKVDQLRRELILKLMKKETKSQNKTSAARYVRTVLSQQYDIELSARTILRVWNEDNA